MFLHPKPQESLFLSVSLQALPLLCSEQRDALGFNADLQHLYATVVTAQGNARTRKRKLSEERPAEEDQPPAEDPDLTPSLGLTSRKTQILTLSFSSFHI